MVWSGANEPLIKLWKHMPMRVCTYSRIFVQFAPTELNVGTLIQIAYNLTRGKLFSQCDVLFVEITNVIHNLGKR